MKVAIELGAFVSGIKLPDDFRFKEWQPYCILVSSPANKENQYLDSQLIAIERISDGRFASFEINALRNSDGGFIERGKVYVSAVALAQAIDNAISELTTQ